MLMTRDALVLLVLGCLISNTVAADDEGNKEADKGNEIQTCGNTYANSTRNSSKLRIIEAQQAEKGAWPWIAEIYRIRGNKKIPSCGGSLISPSYIVTAAHCVTSRSVKLSPSKVSVRLGDHDLESNKDGMNSTDVNVTSIEIHEEYDPTTFANDIALLRLEHPVKFNKNIQPICLPEESINEQNLASNNAYAAGWGVTSAGSSSSDILMEMTVVVTDDDVCREAYEGRTTITELNICTVGRNGTSPCQGFGGGPLMLPSRDNKYYLIGITSFGRGCGDPEYPDVYTRVSMYLDWIQQHVSDEN